MPIRLVPRFQQQLMVRANFKPAKQDPVRGRRKLALHAGLCAKIHPGMPRIACPIQPGRIPPLRQMRGPAQRRDSWKRLAKHNNAIRLFARDPTNRRRRIDPQCIFTRVRLAAFKCRIGPPSPIRSSKDLYGHWGIHRCREILGNRNSGNYEYKRPSTHIPDYRSPISLCHIELVTDPRTHVNESRQKVWCQPVDRCLTNATNLWQHKHTIPAYFHMQKVWRRHIFSQWRVRGAEIYRHLSLSRDKFMPVCVLLFIPQGGIRYA